MNLFDNEKRIEKVEKEPLAYRVRPESLDEFVGQEHIVRDLHRLIRRQRQMCIRDRHFYLMLKTEL